MKGDAVGRDCSAVQFDRVNIAEHVKSDAVGRDRSAVQFDRVKIPVI